MEPVKPSYESYLQDESHIKGDAEYISFPKTEDELLEILKHAYEKKMNITFQGGKTGLTGGAVPGSGLIVNLSNMNKIGEINKTETGATITVGAGTTLEALENRTNSNGYFLPVDPTEKTATLGGIYSVGAAGPGRLKYGDMKRYVESLNLVTPEGKTYYIKKGDKVDKILPSSLTDNLETLIKENNLPFSLEDNDLIDFLSGSEGYLGGITEITLRLLPVPKDIWGVVFFFNNEKEALKFSEIVRNENISCLEFFNEETLKLLDSHRNSPLLKELPPFPKAINTAVYIEVSGDDGEANTETLMNLLGLFSETGGIEENTWAENGAESIRKFRDMRHAVPSILSEDNRIFSGLTRFETDCELNMDPLSLLDFYETRLYEKNLKGIIYGHLLEGRLHVALLPNTSEEREKATEYIKETFFKAIEKKGYGISENGIGQIKINLLKEVLNKETIEVLNEVRAIFDNLKLMNPKLEE